LDREVAIKVRPPERATAVAVERFLREARLLAQLSHPNIVPIFDAQQAGSLLWFVMPFVRGETLAQRLEAGPLPPGEVKRIGLGLLTALQHAHAAGVIHRDIKPANIFLDGDNVLLADFGVALLDRPHDDTLTDTNQVVGTLRYMAPEQRAGQDATIQSDLYAVGAVLFEAASGRKWDPLDSSATKAWHGLPGSVGRVLRRALRTEPANRWPDAMVFRRALEGATRPGRWQFATLLALTAIVTVTTIATRTTRVPADRAPSRAALVVLPFRGSHDSLGNDLAALTSVLIEFSQVHVVPWISVGAISPDSARHLAAYVVTGAMQAHGGRPDLHEVRLIDSTGRTESFTVPGDSADLAHWALTVADTLVNRLFPNELVEFRQLAGMRPIGRALDAYTNGQRLFQSGKWDEGQLQFAVAEQADPQMVQATWQKLIARQWLSLPFKDELDKLAARADSMPEPLPRLLKAETDPDLEQRMARYDSLAREFPDYPMVRQLQANELFSRGPLIGRPLREGIDAFARSGHDIPQLNQANTYTQTVWGAVRIGDQSLARDQLSLRPAPDGDQWSNILRLIVEGRFRRWLAVPMRTVMLFLA
ncbi:MAG: serine/threonine-protein kinase, partial [Gemmatimonadota bacterium]